MTKMAPPGSVSLALSCFLVYNVGGCIQKEGNMCLHNKSMAPKLMAWFFSTVISQNINLYNVDNRPLTMIESHLTAALLLLSAFPILVANSAIYELKNHFVIRKPFLSHVTWSLNNIICQFCNFFDCLHSTFNRYNENQIKLDSSLNMK